jgi:hypothetical protein
MSYDVWLEKDDHAVTEDHNYTYNIFPMLKLADCEMSKLNGQTGEVAGPWIRSAILVMTVAWEQFEKLNSPNGWGDRRGCMRWLEEIARDCETHPKAILRVG